MRPAFSFAFLELERRALEARTGAVGGYSFRDEAVNARLTAAAQRGERRWIVVNQKTGDDLLPRQETGGWCRDDSELPPYVGVDRERGPAINGPEVDCNRVSPARCEQAW